MTETIKISTGVLLTVTTGLMLAESFADFHHAADVLMAQPLMTHQFASAAVADQMAREAKRQHPWTADIDLADFPDLRGLDQPAVEAKCREFLAEHSKRHGSQHEITSPPETRHVPLTEGLPAKFGGSS